MSRDVVFYLAFLSFSKFILFTALRFKIIQIPFFSFFPDVAEHNVTTLQSFCAVHQPIIAVTLPTQTAVVSSYARLWF